MNIDWSDVLGQPLTYVDAAKKLKEMTETPQHIRDMHRAFYDVFGKTPDCDQDRNHLFFRNIMIDYPITDLKQWYDDECKPPPGWETPIIERPPHLYVIQQMYDLWHILNTNEFAREYVTEMALSSSLCPIHFVDYAACFDDDDAECRQIREVHPSHDT